MSSIHLPEAGTTSPVSRQDLDARCYAIQRAGRALSAISHLMTCGNDPQSLDLVNPEDLGALMGLLSDTIMQNLPAVESAAAKAAH